MPFRAVFRLLGATARLGRAASACVSSSCSSGVHPPPPPNAGRGRPLGPVSRPRGTSKDRRKAVSAASSVWTGPSVRLRPADGVRDLGASVPEVFLRLLGVLAGGGGALPLW